MTFRLVILRARVAVVAATLTIFLLGHSISAAELAIGATMPAFSLKDASGQTVSADKLGDKHAVVVVFMDSHCTYCQAYQSRLSALQTAYAAQGVQFVFINPNAVEKREPAAKTDNPFSLLMDETQSVAKSFGATRTPEVFLFGADHKLAYRGQIDDNTEEKMVKKTDLKNALDAVLKGTPQAIEKPITSVFGCTIKWKQG